MEYNDILKAVTIRVTTRDEDRGSGIMYKPLGSDRLYIFTARHCLYGPDFDNKAKRKHIKIDKIKAAKRGTVYTLHKEDRIVEDDNADIVALVIAGERFPGFCDIPAIQLAGLDKDRSEVWFKGYPSLTGGEAQKSGKATLHTMDGEGDRFQVETEAGFLKYYNKSKILGLCKGFSGSGICGRVGETAYLQGIVSRFDKTIGFECVGLRNFLAAKLPVLKLADIAVERYLPDAMLKTNLKQVLEQLKPRYQELNFTLPIEDYFRQLDAGPEYREMVISRVSSFTQALEQFPIGQGSQIKEFFKFYGKLIFSRKDRPKTFQTAYNELLKVISTTSTFFNYLAHDFENSKNWDLARVKVNGLFNLLNEFVSALRKQTNEDAHRDRSKRNAAKTVRKFNGNNQNLLNHLDNLYQFLSDQKFIGKKYMLVKGEAGNGKSQLLGFMAKERMDAHVPTILVLGQSLNREKSIWAQIGEYCCHQVVAEKSFLNILDLKGRLAGRPVILFVDAINEGKGIRLWNYGFNEFMTAIEPYHHIKVVLSYRNSYENALFRNLTVDQSVVIEHRGFEGVEREAVKFFFEDAKMPVPVLPYYSMQFGNPLFLRLFTLLYKNKRGRIELHSWVGTLTVYNHFFEYINDQLGADERFEYESDKLDMVDLAIKKFVKKQLKHRLLYLRYRTAFKLVEKAVRFYTKEKGFFAALISQGLFYENRYLTRGDEDELGVDFAYQKLGEYIKVQFLIRPLTWDKAVLAVIPDGPLFFLANNFEQAGAYAGFIEASTIMIPFYFGREIFELSPGLIEREDVVRAFISALRDRSSATITAKTREYLNQILNRDVQSISKFWTEVLDFSFQPANALNTDFIHDYLLGLTLPKRDASWTIFINNSYEDNEKRSAVSMVINWALNYRKNGITDANAIKAIGKTLFWFFGSTNRQLRDYATKAAVFLFTENIPLLQAAMADFESVNDPYISQRIYAVAFGAVVRNNRAGAVTDLVGYIYQHVFLQPQVVADILLRDYARLAVEYGLHLGLKLPLPEAIRPSYFSAVLPEAPMDQEIERYPINLGYSEDSRYAGIHSILQSMITEHGSRGNMYGDFGRYTFGYAVKHWKDYPDNLLSNLAIQMIVQDLGYDRTLSDIDTSIGYTGRNPAKVERIGKKYQWIVFHRILARLADNYEYYDSSSIYAEKAKFSGAWEPNVRDIDPTTSLRPELQKPGPTWWLRHVYELTEQPMATWLKDNKDLPDPQKLLEVVDDQGDSWLVLETHRNWNDGDRELWYQLRSYIIRKAEQKRITEWLTKQNLMGRWMPESQSKTEFYLREYFWSPAIKDFADAYHGGELWQELRSPKDGKKIGEISVATLEYLWEKGTDNSQMGATSLLLPNQVLFDIMNLKHGAIDGHFENEDGNVVAFDPAALYNTPSCLLILKKELLEALDKAQLAIFWTGLGEKLNTGHYDKNQPDLFKRLEISNILSFNGNELIVSTLTVTPEIN